MRWALLLVLAFANLACLMFGPGMVYAWRAGECPRWWFPQRRFRRLVLQYAPTLAQWERTIAADPFGADPFKGGMYREHDGRH